MHMEFARLTGVYRLIEPKEGSKPLAIDLELDPGRKTCGRLVGPNGKPVTGATAYGLRVHPWGRPESAGQELRSNTFTATLLDGKRPRTLFFLQVERKLVGRVSVRGDEKEAAPVRMQPWGVLTGRLVGGDNTPRAGVTLWWRYPSLPSPNMLPPTREFQTDREGRFRIEGLMPGLKFEIVRLDDRKKPVPLSTDGAVKDLTMKVGQTRDLGDVRVKGPNR
jgi:hypothetical protein